MENVIVWPVEKYARFVSSPKPDASGSAAKKPDGTWQHYSSREGSIQMALLESNHLMISSGTMIFESFTLWEAQKWVKIVTKGDSAMFIYKLKDENRRFRVKFLPANQSTTSLETCKHFSTVLAPLAPIKDMGGSCTSTVAGAETSTRAMEKTSMRGMESDSQLMMYEDTQMTGIDSQVVPGQYESLQSQGDRCTMPAVGGIPRGQSTDDPVVLQQKSDGSRSSGADDGTRSRGTVVQEPDEASLVPVPDLGKLLQAQSKPLGRAYADTNFPTGQIGAFIRLCLTDANFPKFVEAVETELNSMTGST